MFSAIVTFGSYFRQTSKNILYAFLECWNTIKQQKRIQSDPLSSQLKEMYRLRPIIGPLLFLYSVEFKSVIDLYKTFHTVTGATLGGQLSKDLAVRLLFLFYCNITFFRYVMRKTNKC